MKILNIAFATDDYYMKQTFLAIESVLMNSGITDVSFRFFVLSSDTNRFDVYCGKILHKYKNCTIKKIEIEKSFFEDAPITIAHITTPTFYRLLLPELVEADKCLYLDSDVLVCDSLFELYDTSIEGYNMAGIIAPYYHQMYNNGQEYAIQIGIPSMDQYINAGVLLLNLEEMRKVEFTKKALNLIRNPFPTQDQDIINLLSYNKIKLLPYKYNVQVSREKYENVILQEEREEAKTHPIILHYSDCEKPWRCPNVPMADKWWKICRKSLWYDDFFKEQKESFIYYSVIKNMYLWKIPQYSSKWIDEVKKYKKCYIYGAGKLGESAVSYCKKKEIPITNIIVSKIEGNKENIQGIEVKEFSEDVEEDALIFIAVSKKYQVQIIEMLFRYNRFYIMMLDGR